VTISSKRIADLIRQGSENDRNGISITPEPDVPKIRTSGESSVSLRLGRWFLSMKQTRQTQLDTLQNAEDGGVESTISKRHFVPFGEPFAIHPNRFVLATTLEWIKLPLNVSGYVVGKSTWGRRGIVIETAAGVHPGFSGCLTLEIANLGEVPVRLRPGMEICQLFLHDVVGDVEQSRTSLAGRRKPILGKIKADRIFNQLSAKLPLNEIH